MSINEWMADYKNSLDTQEELPQQEKAPHIEQCDTVLTGKVVFIYITYLVE